MLHPTARRTLLTGTAISAIFTAFAAYSQDTSTFVLDTIEVENDYDATETTTLGGEDVQDTGVTVIGSTSVQSRTDTSGDANTALRTVPTVQYADDTNDDAGENGDDALNLQPMEVSISGGTVTENNIMIDGMGINSLTGTTDPYASSPRELSRVTTVPNIFSVFGLHSQTQFVPDALVETAEVMDSNVSAEYGEFTGGAVNYKLKKPSREKSGSLSINYSSDKLVDYKIGTEDGTNPDDVSKPEWDKYGLALTLNTPINDRAALLFGYSRRQAETVKEMNEQYVAREVGGKSHADYYMGALQYDLDNGGRFMVGANFSDSRMDWASNYIDGLEIGVVNQGFSTYASYEKDLEDFTFLGARNMTFSSRLSYQNNKTENDQNGNVATVWYGSYARDGFYTDNFSDWCTPVEGENVLCYTGAFGDRTYEDHRLKAEAKVEGDIWRGSFKLGGAVEHVKANRTGEGFTLNSASTRITETDLEAFVCADGDDTCYSDIFMDTKVVQPSYNVSVSATKVEGFLEFDQSLGAVDLRTGLRLDYNDYLDDVNIAPRLSATWHAAPRLDVTFGANRYYSGNYVSYALHDAMPRTTVYKRDYDETTGEVGEWEEGSTSSTYYYSQDGLKTPYNDELTLALAYKDPYTDGDWRLKVIDRRGKDMFARSQDSSSSENILTNEGSSQYTSVTLEYANTWKDSEVGFLKDLGFYASAVWADRWVSNETYFGSSGETGEGEDFIWYDGQSYTSTEFQQVTGNLDIPVRATFELSGTTRNKRVRLGLGTDVTFGYLGVIDSGDNEDHDHSTYGSQSHDVYEDYKFSTAISTYLSAAVKLTEVKGNPVELNVKVSNLFNDIGNAVSDDDNPWVSGRSASIGVNYTW